MPMQLRDMYDLVRLLKKTHDKQIWLICNHSNGEVCVAKIQSMSRDSRTHRTVLHEGKFLQIAQGYKGIPFLHWVGKDEHSDSLLLIIEKLGNSLSDLLTVMGGKFTLKTVCLVGVELFEIVRMYHSKKYVHGHLALSGIQTGIGKNSHLFFLNDLMDSHSYVNKVSLKHIQNLKGKKVKKFNMFMLPERLIGTDFSRRDDVYAVVLMMVFMLKGSLPWSGLFEEQKFMFESSPNVDLRCFSNDKTLKYNAQSMTSMDSFKLSDPELLMNAMKVSVGQICEGVPCEFAKMLASALSLGFSDEPDYNYFTRQLKNLLAKHDFLLDYTYDWMRNSNYVSDQLKLKRDELVVPTNPAHRHATLCKFDMQDLILEGCYEPYAQNMELS